MKTINFLLTTGEYRYPQVQIERPKLYIIYTLSTGNNKGNTLEIKKYTSYKQQRLRLWIKLLTGC